ncbi:hypothetical protein Tco_0313116 [Tanacetum coccineum]
MDDLWSIGNHDVVFECKDIGIINVACGMTHQFLGETVCWIVNITSSNGTKRNSIPCCDESVFLLKEQPICLGARVSDVVYNLTTFVLEDRGRKRHFSTDISWRCGIFISKASPHSFALNPKSPPQPPTPLRSMIGIKDTLTRRKSKCLESEKFLGAVSLPLAMMCGCTGFDKSVASLKLGRKPWF